MKTKIEKVSSLEADITSKQLKQRLSHASKAELIDIICAMSENIVNTTAQSPDVNTGLYLSAKFICNVLDKQNKAMKTPLTNKGTNDRYMSEIVNVFGSHGQLNEQVKHRRLNKIKQMTGRR